MDDKYVFPEDTDFKFDDSYIRAKNIDDYSVTIDSIRFSNTTDDKIDDNGECVVRPPKAEVLFSNGHTLLKQNYILEPFASRIYRRNPKELFGTLLTSTDTEWSRLSDLIGSRVKIESKSGDQTFKVTADKPRGSFSSLSEAPFSQINHPDIQTKFSSILKDFAQNKTVGLGKIKNIKIYSNGDEDFATVIFSLDTGHEFSNVFMLSERDEKEEQSGGYSNTIFSNKNRRFIFGRNQRDEEVYNFWNLCKDTIGYIPDANSYDTLIGKRIDVEYNSGSWYVSGKID